MSTPRKWYVAKYALTSGILVLHESEGQVVDVYVRLIFPSKAGASSFTQLFKVGTEAHTTMDAAKAYAIKMATAKLASLERQHFKLETLISKRAFKIDDRTLPKTEE